MFDKIKQADRFRRLQGEMKKEQEQIYVQSERQGIKILIRGDKRVEKLEVDGVENKPLRDLINDTMKEVDKKLEKQMRSYAADLGLGI